VGRKPSPSNQVVAFAVLAVIPEGDLPFSAVPAPQDRSKNRKAQAAA
jgi:hypothetical protein